MRMGSTMSKANLQLQRQLLATLADGRFHSGQVLAEQFGVSRTAIANYIQELERVGLDIFRVKGKGYSLTRPLQLLDAAQIRQLQDTGAAPVLVQHITDSTNAQLMQALQHNTVPAKSTVVVAEAQTAGRGRRGRPWYSPFGSNLYFSYYWRLEQGMQAAMGLSLVAGCAVCALLRRDYQVEATLKWPNDIYIDQRKVAGVLVELAGQADATCDVVIGVGLNITLSENAMQHISQPYAELTAASGVKVDRNALVVQLQKELTAALQLFERQGFKPFQQVFNQVDLFAGRMVTLSGSAAVSGICKGVDERGALLLQLDDRVQAFWGGELSLRAAD